MIKAWRIKYYTVTQWDRKGTKYSHGETYVYAASEAEALHKGWIYCNGMDDARLKYYVESVEEDYNVKPEEN